MTTAASDFGDGAVASAALSVTGVADSSATLTLRWFRFAAGSTPNDDYRPIGSEGVGLALLAELAQVCIAFHPHNDIRQFPKRRPALLYFRANSTGDYVLLRIGLKSGGAESDRPTLEYDGLILTASDLREFGLNPFAPGDYGLFEEIQRAATTDTAGARLQATLTPLPPHVLPEDAEEWAFTSGTERVISDAEVEAIETLCRLKAARGATSPFFATWWESAKPVPAGYFDIVLRAPSPRGLSSHAIEEMATHLASDSASTAEGDAIDAVRTYVVSTLRACGQMTPPQFRSAMVEAAEDLRRICERIETESDEESDHEAERSLIERCRGFEAELRKMRHPDPFAAGRFDLVEAEARAEAKAASQKRRRLRSFRRHRLMLALAAVAFALIVLAVVIFVCQKRYHTIK